MADYIWSLTWYRIKYWIRWNSWELIGGAIFVGVMFIGYQLYQRESLGDTVADNCKETGLYFVIDNHSRIGAIYDCSGTKIVGPAGEWRTTE